MALFDFLLKANAISDRAELSAAYIEDYPLASPYADSSHLETLTLANLYGLTPDELPVNRRSAMAIASLAKGRNLICTSIARMPLHAVKGGTPVADQPALLKQLEVGVPSFITLSWTVDSMLFYGRAFWLISEKDYQGRPLHIRYVPEAQVETKDGQLVKAFGKSVGPTDFIRLDANHEGLLNFGASVIREAQEIELAAREAGSSPVPSIVLKQREGSSTADEVKSMVSGWVANRRKRGGSVAYVNKAIDVESLGAHSEHLLIDARNVASLQVARALGLPAWAVDASVQGASLNYSNQASRNRELIDSLTAYLVSVEQTLSLFLPHGTQVKFDTTELLKEDTKGRYENYATAIASGVLTVNEARAYENLPALPASEQINPVTPVEPEANPTEETE